MESQWLLETIFMSPEPTTTQLASERTQMATERTDMATDRTWLAYERTLMAWVRTAVSMISFGFTIYKFFQFEAGQNAKVIQSGLLTPRSFALIIVSIGLISLGVATYQNRKQQRKLIPKWRFSLADLVAGLVSLFGILVLLSALFQE
jgi:putative membrane protein